MNDDVLLSSSSDHYALYLLTTRTRPNSLRTALRLLMLPVVPSRMCRKISEGFEPASSQPPTADAGFQLFRAFSHFVPAFRKNERARHRPRNYFFFFPSPFFLSSSFSCWSRNHNYIHLVLPPYLSILASIYLPPPSRHHPFLFLRVEGGGERDAPININGCGSFPLLSRTIYCLTSATADALLFAPEQRIAMLGRKEQQPRQRQKKDKIKRRKRLNKKIGKSQKRKREKKKNHSCRRHTGKNKKKTTSITFRVPR